MACSCRERKEVHRKIVDGEAPLALNEKVVQNAQAERISPTEQCIACAQKHMDEAYVLFTEFGYGNENRRLVRGNLRAIVLHTFREWKEIANLARECALLVQEARDEEALGKMQGLCGMIDGEFYKVNPDVKKRMESLAPKQE